MFLARSRAGKLVAIKTIAEARNERHDGETANAFAREASVCVRLRHPCIVQVRAFLEEPGFAALVFEYVPGVALGRILRLCQANGVRLPDLAAWHVTERVLTALAYAHGFRDESGQATPIVHRDVSPSNVLLDWSGGVKLTDFGIAKVLGVASGTRLGVIKGTLGCMAPEQARGEAVDQRADVYAAALLAWRLATGRLPFGRHQKDEYELLRAMRNPRFVPLASLRPELPEPLLDAVAAALEPERERRTITAEQLAAAVRAHIDVTGGEEELALLLERWKGALERTVKRTVHPPLAETLDASSLAGRAAHTVRYEEVALAFDDEAPVDGPTLEAHALPSDPSVLTAMPRVPEELLISMPLVPAALPMAAPPVAEASPVPTPLPPEGSPVGTPLAAPLATPGPPALPAAAVVADTSVEPSPEAALSTTPGLAARPPERPPAPRRRVTMALLVALLAAGVLAALLAALVR